MIIFLGTFTSLVPKVVICTNFFMIQHAMLFFLHHCELPSLDRLVNRMNREHVNPHHNIQPQPQVLQHHIEDADIPQRENAAQVQMDSSVHREENDAEMNENPDNPGHPVEENDRPSTSRIEEQGNSTLMRSQLHKVTGTESDDTFIKTASVPSQENQSRHQLSDENLRKIRLQHFERKHD